MDRRSFFKFLGFGAAAAPVVAAELAALPVPAIPAPIPAPVPTLLVPTSPFPRGLHGTYSITLRMPGSSVSHNWGIPHHAGPYVPPPKPVRDREFYRLRHARKHEGF